MKFVYSEVMNLSFMQRDEYGPTWVRFDSFNFENFLGNAKSE